MSKYLNVSTGDYKITVENDGNIILDTGEPGAPGSVIVTGDLVVQGETTSVSSTNLIIEDNIIVLNRGDPDNPPNTNGVLADGGTAGIRIERGNLSDAFWIFDESIKWEDPFNPGQIGEGGWAARNDNGNPIGVSLTSITTPQGSDLNLLGVYNGPGDNPIPNPGKLTVKGTVDYEDRVTSDDDIPNKKYVDDSIQLFLGSVFQDTIREGTFAGTETFVEVQDDTVTSNPSKIRLVVDGVDRSTYYDTYVDMYDIRIDGNTILTTNENENLVLKADAIGSVEVDDDLILTKTPHGGTGVVDPGNPPNGVKLYSKVEDVGGTGLYFVNETTRRDEIISNNRALVYSMIF